MGGCRARSSGLRLGIHQNQVVIAPELYRGHFGEIRNALDSWQDFAGAVSPSESDPLPIEIGFSLVAKYCGASASIGPMLSSADESRGHRPSTEPSLTFDDIRAPSHAERARTLVAQQRTGVLSTLTEDGFPYGSYVTFALHGATPVFLISAMASHTENLKRDARASLLVHEHGATDPLANGRITLVGRCSRLPLRLRLERPS